jgi:ABC-type multidrug transport system ATPase subunit
MLTVSGLSVTLPGFALGPVDLRAAPGDFVSLIGPNGSGKSTLISAMLGLRRPDLGSSCWAGADLSRRNPRDLAAVAYVSDSSEDVLREFSAQEYWQYSRVVREDAIGRPLPHAMDRAAEIAHALDFPGAARPLAQLSLGTRRKAQIVAALMTDPEFVVLDEPFIGLDFLAARALEQVLRGICAAGTTVLSSSHDLDLASRISTRALVLYAGRVCLNARVADLGGHSMLEQAVLDAIGRARAGRLGADR